MSSTGRGPRLGGEHDFYSTPRWCVDRLLDEWDPPGGLWIEPGAGNGAIIRAVNARRDDVSWCAVEIREEEEASLGKAGAGVLIGDFLADAVGPSDTVTTVIGNPPYSLAQEFIEQSQRLFPMAFVCFLLRVNFLASEERNAFVRKHPPTIYVLPNRPAFSGGKTDSCEYAWFVWPNQFGLANLATGYGRLRVLGTTPLSARKRAESIVTTDEEELSF